MIDLRSDTVTRPTKEMKEYMMSAPVGDDVFNEDPTVNELQQKLANMLGKEAALFAPSGTQSNLLALMSHCERGDEYIVGNTAHTYKYEGGGAAVLGSIQPQPIHYRDNGTFDLEELEGLIKPIDDHFARTKLICYENTLHGLAVDPDHYGDARKIADKYGLKMHLDGARLFNACAQLKISPKEMAEHFDSVSICLSKGLGTPAGSVLVGSKELIAKAHRWRKVLGGGMRQVGILAAAGIYALDKHVERLKVDHERAKWLSFKLAKHVRYTVYFDKQQTNMVFMDVPKEHLDLLYNHMLAHDILIYPGTPLRMVIHLDITEEDLQKVFEAFKSFKKPPARISKSSG